MINTSLSLILILFVVTTPVAFSSDDPMKSLFLFQQKMAKNGNFSAMMKMGLMYERGEGVEKSYDNALKMYQQASDAGYAKAKIAIQRVNNLKNKSTSNKKRESQEKELQRILAAEKLREQRKVILRKKAAETAKAANNKILLNETLKRKKAAKAKTKTKAKAARIIAKEKRQPAKKPKEGFKSDPCKSKAARLLSICR